jgi:hypothetical protein
MQRSDEIDKVSAALVAACGELQNVVADAVNPHFKSQYASLPAILDTVRPVLAKHGLAVVQLPVTRSDGIGVETTILHETGQYISGVLTVHPQKDDPQGAGGAITYCRRYALTAALGIGQDDDDANAVSHAPQQRPAFRPVAPPPAAAPATAGGFALSEPQRKRMFAKAKARYEALHIADADPVGLIKSVLAAHGLASSAAIASREVYEAVCDGIDAWTPPASADDFDTAEPPPHDDAANLFD